MKRALAVLTVAAYLTLVVDVAGGGRPWLSLLPGTAFLLLATLGFAGVQRRPDPGRRAVSWPRWAYVAVLYALGGAVFGASGASVGATLLLVVLVGQTVLLLPPAAVVVVVVTLPLFHMGMAWPAGLREGLGLLACAVFTAVVTKLLIREQAARAALAEANDRLQRYARQAEHLAAAQERNRVARDIHDGLGHALTVVQMQIKAARAVLGAQPERADAVLAKAQDQAEEALREVRRSVSALRERPAGRPLPEALLALAAQTSAAGVPTEVDVHGAARSLVAEAEETLFRAAQEGLTNVRRHARATRAAVVIDYSRPAAVRIEIRDDGAGREDGSEAGFGLLGVHERAIGVGGRMTFESIAAGGCVLRVEVPG